MDWLHQCLDRLPVLLHCNTSLIDPNFDQTELQELVDLTTPCWLSLHLDLPRTRLYNWWKRIGVPVPLMTAGRAHHLGRQNLARLLNNIQLPVALENQAYHRHSGHDYLVEPRFQKTISEGASFLLDLGHARVSAAMLGMAVEAYLEQLPLGRVLEIHTSGPRLYRGRLRDIHATLQPVDYKLLDWAIQHCLNCEAVTLEYYGPEHKVERQLNRLQVLLSQPQP